MKYFLTLLQIMSTPFALAFSGLYNKSLLDGSTDFPAKTGIRQLVSDVQEDEEGEKYPPSPPLDSGRDLRAEKARDRRNKMPTLSLRRALLSSCSAARGRIGQ
ncbi:uncharacterized protein C17orf67 homolog isoform X1 [Xiphias gladius]|uniref:uncharacterized protein C17orf67 homolog isoform X1 n=1 Tax=Xiphias gladius TaxID=8245 RepID=UPI001A99640A|nr:uncharacterized protein C17orf67 homolog isoform X1 [Xiphias gladius]